MTIDARALFLGPKAENQELYESLILEIVRDSCFLRKNFHPLDKPIVTEKVKLSEEFSGSVALLKQNLQFVLAELKKGVPLYHPRYIGHMHGDLLLSAIAAYFGTILYNSNNVVGESSPATTKMEIDYIDALCRMVGYNPCEKLSGNFSWGHLCSGGTTANIEALWVLRNIKYYPLTLKLASQLNEDKQVKFIEDLHINFINKTIKQSSFNELFNLPVSEILNLKDKIYDESEEKLKVKNAIEKYSVTQLGVFGIHDMIGDITGNTEKIALPKVYVAKSNHYSWEKAMDIIGIGRNQLEKVEIDNGYRLDLDCLTEKIDSTKGPTLAVISIMGSSKQGSIDPLDQILKYRKQKEAVKYSFAVHVDAAYGGYFPSILWKTYDSEKFLKNDEILKFLNNEVELFRQDGQSSINQNWCNKIKAVNGSNSITIDPHKMGYIPYPAGSILFSDTRMKDFISYEPSYLNKSDDDLDLHNSFLGQWTLEGSRPGAAAAACFMSNKVLPFNQSAHGLLVKNTMQSADNFWKSIETFNANSELNKGFKIVPLYIPETNIISYVVAMPKVIQKTKYLNQLNNGLYKRFSVKGDTIIPAQDFMIAKDGFDYKDIPPQTLLSKCEIDEAAEENKSEKITILSSVFMNPLSKYLLDDNKDFYIDFWQEVAKSAEEITGDIMLDILGDSRNSGERINLLWIEDDVELNKLKKQILSDGKFGRCLDITFTNNVDDASLEIIDKKRAWDIYIIDLNLKTKHDLYAKTPTPQDFDDIAVTKKLIELLPVEKRNKIILYSSYFNNNKMKQSIIPELKTMFNGQKNWEDYLIAKSGDFHQDKRKITQGIFSISQRTMI